MTTSKATPTSKAPTFYGITAKQFKVLVAAEANPTKLGDMLAFVRKRIADHQAKGLATKVSRWERVSEALVARLNGQPSAVPALANAATFTTVTPKSSAKKSSRKAKSVGLDLDGFLAQSGLTPEALMLQLAARVTK